MDHQNSFANSVEPVYPFNLGDALFSLEKAESMLNALLGSQTFFKDNTVTFLLRDSQAYEISSISAQTLPIIKSLINRPVKQDPWREARLDKLISIAEALTVVSNNVKQERVAGKHKHYGFTVGLSIGMVSKIESFFK